MTRRQLLKLGAATAAVPSLPMPAPFVTYRDGDWGIGIDWRIVRKSDGQVMLSGDWGSLGLDPTAALLDAWEMGRVIFYDDDGTRIGDNPHGT